MVVKNEVVWMDQENIPMVKERDAFEVDSSKATAPSASEAEDPLYEEKMKLSTGEGPSEIKDKANPRQCELKRSTNVFTHTRNPSNATSARRSSTQNKI